MQRPPQNTYEAAREAAWAALQQRSLALVAANGLLQLEETSGRVIVPFLADRYFVDVRARKVFFENGSEVYPFLSVLLLHYLVGVTDKPLSGEWISFREFEGGEVYFGSFNDRTLIPLK